MVSPGSISIFLVLFGLRGPFRNGMGFNVTGPPVTTSSVLRIRTTVLYFAHAPDKQLDRIIDRGVAEVFIQMKKAYRYRDSNIIVQYFFASKFRQNENQFKYIHLFMYKQLYEKNAVEFVTVYNNAAGTLSTSQLFFFLENQMFCLFLLRSRLLLAQLLTVIYQFTLILNICVSYSNAPTFKVLTFQ